MKKYKMYCIFAKESIDKMNGIRGKLATQAGHAYLHAYWDAERAFEGPWWDEYSTEPDTPEIKESRRLYEVYANRRRDAINYRASGMAYKITLVVDTVAELEALQEKYKEVCGVSLVTDRGLTVFKEPTTTCLGLGPIAEDKIGDDLNSLLPLT